MTEFKHTPASVDLNLDNLEALARAVDDLPETTQPFVSTTGQIVIHTFSMSREQVDAVARLYDAASPAKIVALIALARRASPDTPTGDVRHAFERYMANRGQAVNYEGDGLYAYQHVNDQSDAFKAGVKYALAEQSSHLTALICWSCKKPYTYEQRLESDGNCPHCGVEIELDDGASQQPAAACTPAQAVDALKMAADFIEGIKPEELELWREAKVAEIRRDIRALSVAPEAAHAGEGIIEIAARIFDFKPHKHDDEAKGKYLRFAEAILAHAQQAPVQRNDKLCPECSGSGYYSLAEAHRTMPEPCNECGGGGRVCATPATAVSPSDYTVDDSELAHKVMMFMGRHTTQSMEPGADPLRDRLAERLAVWRPTRTPAPDAGEVPRLCVACHADGKCVGKMRMCSARSETVAVSPSEPKPYGWVQIINGQQTQNFARDEYELATVKEIAAVCIKDGQTVEYVPVFDRPAPPDAKNAEHAVYDEHSIMPLLADWFGADECKGNWNPKRFAAFVNAAMEASRRDGVGSETQSANKGATEQVQKASAAGGNRVLMEQWNAGAYTKEIAEGAALMAALFKVLTLKQKNSVRPEFAVQFGRFMVRNGYRIAFNNWYLQAEPRTPAATSGSEVVFTNDGREQDRGAYAANAGILTHEPGTVAEWERCRRIADSPAVAREFRNLLAEPEADIAVHVVCEVIRAAERDRASSADAGGQA